MFDSAKLKVERAKHHIDGLEQAFRHYADTHPKSLTISHHTEDGPGFIAIHVGEMPSDIISLILADAIHNLRAALDHANWELRGLNGGTQDRHTTLPIRPTKASFEAACNGIRTPVGDLPHFFKSLEFYEHGKGHLIYALHDLDVEDKHMFLPIIAPSRVIQASDGTTASVTFSDGYIARTSLEMNEIAHSPLEICFGNIQTFPFAPIMPTLLQLTNAVKQIIMQFEAFIANRT